MNQQQEQTKIQLVSLGSFPTRDARTLLDALSAQDIRFEMAPARCGCGQGIGVAVHIDDHDRAAKIQTELFPSAETTMEEEVPPEPMNPEDDFHRCPKCSSVEVLYDSFSWREELHTQFLIFAMPWLWKEKKWHCRHCKNTWEASAP